VIKRGRGRIGWLLPLFVALLVCVQSGCGLVFGRPDTSPSMGKEEIEKLMLEHLHEKYGEDFAVSSISQDSDILGATGNWTMGAYRVGDSKERSLFIVKWSQPGSGSAILDGYLLVKMRLLFHDAIDEGLASVLPEFMAEYNLFTTEWKSYLDSLPGRISDEDFLQWATQNIAVSIRVATPAKEGITEDEFTAQIAPLVVSGNTFGASKVELQIAVYFPEGYVSMGFSPPCLGPDLYGGLRTYPGGSCGFYDAYGSITEKIQFQQTVTLKAK